MKLLLPLCLLVATLPALAAERPSRKLPSVSQPPWHAVHLLAPETKHLPLVERAIAEQLALAGINLIVFEVNYRFAWRSHSELAQTGAIPTKQARALAATCCRHGIRLIPLCNCLGHQSWGNTTFPLLAK